MNEDTFGNLDEWGHVLERLHELKRSRDLDEHQEALARLLRYRDNWRLREKVLEYIHDIENPTEELLAELVHIMTEDDVYLEARALAAKALGHLIPRRKTSSEEKREFDKTRLVSHMINILESERPPYLRAAVAKSLAAMGDNRVLPVLQEMSQSPNSSPLLKKCVDEAILEMS
jgi:HEAT repeat protein